MICIYYSIYGIPAELENAQKKESKTMKVAEVLPIQDLGLIPTISSRALKW